MKNIEKYTNTKDAMKAYKDLGLKEVPFDTWLECEVEEPRVPTLFEAAQEVKEAWFANMYPRYFPQVSEAFSCLWDAVEREKRKPIRNCDKYRTAADARVGFIEFCRKYTCGKCRFVNKGKPVGCAIEWLYGDASKDESK